MCPRRHRQISWFAAERMVHCWLCEKDYPLSDCFGTPSTSSSTEQELELPEILKIQAGEMEKDTSDGQKNWKEESTSK